MKTCYIYPIWKASPKSGVLINKPTRANMRPDCVFACIDHVTYMEKPMDEQTGEMTKK